MAIEYRYDKEADAERLTQEVEGNTSITIVLEYINANGSELTLFFRAALPAADKAALDALVAAHENIPLPAEDDAIPVNAFPHYASDGTPYVYPTARPVGHASYFTGASDNGPGPEGTGKGPTAFFNVKAADKEVVHDLTFNDAVYLKDGLILSRGAPFGAEVDIEILHPVNGHILWFGKAVPILGDYPIALDTEDRALLPPGIIVRITIRNSNGLEGQDPPADFLVAGRLELYRPMPEIEL